MSMQKFVRENERREMTGVPISTWYEMMDDGLAPKPVPIGPRAVAWLASELEEWQRAVIEKRDVQRPDEPSEPAPDEARAAGKTSG